MPAQAAISSAAGLLALLDEPNDELKHHALTHLNKLVHDYWFQISGALGSLEALYEDEDFKHRELAALVASKVQLRRLAGFLKGCSFYRPCVERCTFPRLALQAPLVTSLAMPAYHPLVVRAHEHGYSVLRVSMLTS